MDEPRIKHSLLRDVPIAILSVVAVVIGVLTSAIWITIAIDQTMQVFSVDTLVVLSTVLFPWLMASSALLLRISRPVRVTIAMGCLLVCSVVAALIAVTASVF